MTTPTLPSIAPYLIVDGGAAALAFYVHAFGAEEDYRLTDPSGRIGHAELKLGTVLLMLADEHPELDLLGPKRRGGTSCSLALTVPDVDTFVARAVAAGATLERPIKDEFYGQRVGWLRDPFGHRWSIAGGEPLSGEEIKKRYAQLMTP
jgi:uncharacterized glyoxalase superfamily protein PhnB